MRYIIYIPIIAFIISYFTWVYAVPKKCKNNQVGFNRRSPWFGKCTQCEEGKTRIQGTDLCAVCAAGRSIIDDVCVPCKAGFYSSGLDSPCYACGAGTFSSTGSVVCTMCPKNTYGPTSELSECLACPEGTYTISKGSRSKNNCI